MFSYFDLFTKMLNGWTVFFGVDRGCEIVNLILPKNVPLNVAQTQWSLSVEFRSATSALLINFTLRNDSSDEVLKLHLKHKTLMHKLVFQRAVCVNHLLNNLLWNKPHTY